MDKFNKLDMSKKNLNKESLFKKVFNFAFEDMFEELAENITIFILTSVVLLAGTLFKRLLDKVGMNFIAATLIYLVALVISNIIRKIIDMFYYK